MEYRITPRCESISDIEHFTELVLLFSLNSYIIEP